MDGQNYDSQARASIAASHGKNGTLVDSDCIFLLEKWEMGWKILGV